MEVVYQFILKGAVALIAASGPVLIAHLIAYVNVLLARIHSDLIRAYAEMAVQGVEQKFAKRLSNESKKQTVLALLEARFPRVPAEVLDAILEAAVAGLPKAA